MKTICIGPGHGGTDPGACNGKRREADDNLRLALAVGKQLQAQGHKVVYTRTADITMTPAQRRQVAVDCKADFYIDIHRNSFTDPSAKGIEMWIRSAAYLQAATEVMAQLAQVENQANRGIKIGSYAVLYNMPMPAMLLELGFISNARDNELYDKHFEGNDTAITRGILAALGEPYKQSGQATKTPKQSAYIQLGSYTWPDNEKGLRSEVERIRALGIECFPVIPVSVKENE